jgi:hypothetical protein
MRQKNMATGAGDISLPDVSKLNDLKDEQIEALIEKLAEVQAHAPQIIAALEAQQEARSRGSKSQGSKGDRNNRGSSDRGERTQPPKQQQQQQQQQQATRRQSLQPAPTSRRQLQQNDYIEEEEEEDDGGDEEEDDDFDEDAEYPMVGDGYSDELSVVSDMTTPTVVSTLEINDEEFYKDMVIGGMKVSAPKKKDLLSQVAKTNARKASGAANLVNNKKKPIAAADVALKKPARAASNYSTRPGAKEISSKQPEPVIPASAVKTKKSRETGNNTSSSPGPTSTPTPTKKVKKKVVKKTPSPQNSGSGGWDTANGGPSSRTKKKGPLEKKPQPVMIDDDGFLVDQSTFETFDSSYNPFTSAATLSFAAPDGPDAFAAFDSFNDAPPQPSRTPRRTTKPKKLNVTSTGTKKGTSSASTAGSSPQQKRKTRRASLGI